MRYHIMNKDTKVLFFDIPENSADFNIVVMGVYNQALIPRPIKSEDDIKSWLVTRLRLINRNDLANELAMDVSTLEKITELTNFISVTDTYWVQTDNITRHWSEISPYTNNLDSNIFLNYFDKSPIRLGAYSVAQISQRCWGKKDDNICFYKSGYDANIAFVEYQSSQLGKYLGFDIVEYRIENIDGRTVTVSPCICSEETGMYNVLELLGRSLDCRELFSLDFGEDEGVSQRKLIDMLLLDYLVLNTDRNMTNVGVLFDTDTNELKGIAPIYDLNHTLLYNSRPTEETLKEYLESIENDNSWYIEIFKYILNIDRDYVKKLLTKASSYTFTGTYADIANEVLQHQLKLAYSLL